MEKLCRICRTSESIDELSEFYDDPKIPVDFYFITGIKVVSIDPSNPALICSTCTDSIKIFTKFKRKAQKSDEFFHLQSQKYEQNYWDKLKSENFGPATVIKEEPELLNWDDIGNIEDNSNSNLDFIDENEEQFELLCDELADQEELSDQTGPESVDISTKVAGPKSKTRRTASNSSSTASRNKALPCSICGKRLSSTKTLEIHMIVIHNADNKVYTCSHCQKIFKHISYVKKHVENHHGLSYLKTRDVVIKVIKNCDKSPVDFQPKTPTFDPEIFGDKVTRNCNICGREFSSTRSCRDHMIIAHGAAKDVYVCKICDGRFKLKDYLARHMKNQHKTVPNDDNFSVHENENEEENYEEIDKDIVDMARPQKTRTAENYCRECDRSFSSTRSYSEHMKIRHKSDNKIYICKFCDEKFIVPSYLKKHVKKVHNHTLMAHEIIVKRKNDAGSKKVKIKKELRDRGSKGGTGMEDTCE
ncbi:zinc finger protein piragua-like [Chironomus tepperi]|uniref:zinc finger protein piragua-like n=1 Tax=Chironomus tepperi TaxID=113505 RepID=UPI00391F47F4